MSDSDTFELKKGLTLVIAKKGNVASCYFAPFEGEEGSEKGPPHRQLINHFNLPEEEVLFGGALDNAKDGEPLSNVRWTSGQCNLGPALKSKVNEAGKKAAVKAANNRPPHGRRRRQVDTSTWEYCRRQAEEASNKRRGEHPYPDIEKKIKKGVRTVARRRGTWSCIPNCILDAVLSAFALPTRSDAWIGSIPLTGCSESVAKMSQDRASMREAAEAYCSEWSV